MHFFGVDCLIRNDNIAINQLIIILHLHIKHLFQFLMLPTVCMHRRGLHYILVLLIYPATLCSGHTDTAFLADAVSTQTYIPSLTLSILQECSQLTLKKSSRRVLKLW